MSALVGNVGWMGWNLVLALVPLGLARFLFGHRPRPVWLLWTGGVAFVAFLPNAPYVLTDVLHLPDEMAAADGSPWLAAALLAQYACLVGVGFVAYVLALVRLERWLAGRGHSRGAVLGIDLSLHALCAVGILLGRVRSTASPKFGLLVALGRHPSVRRAPMAGLRPVPLRCG